MIDDKDDDEDNDGDHILIEMIINRGNQINETPKVW